MTDKEITKINALNDMDQFCDLTIYGRKFVVISRIFYDALLKRR